MECTQIIDISNIGFDISDLGRVKVGTLIVNDTSYDIYKGENIIGRDELSDIVLRNNSISSKHAVVEVEDWDTHLLFDCGSTNKTRLGKIFLKPNVRYHLQGGEDIFFADLKAKYVKLDKPEADQNGEDSVSDAGSESLLNSVPADQEADLDIGNDDQVSHQGQINQAGDDNSRDGSSMLSDLNDSSLLEENKQKGSSSKLQIVDASDDSTDDEADFIFPSQTVKEFASKKQLAQKKSCIKNTSYNMFSSEKAILNTQDQELIFMTENTDCNKISNSLNLNSQSLFSSELQDSLKPKGIIISDPSIFEAETQVNNYAVETNVENAPKSKMSKDIFDAETEVPGDNNYGLEKNKENAPESEVSKDIFDAETEVPRVSASGDDVDMSDLQLSNALTEPGLIEQKASPINIDQIENDHKIEPSLIEQKTSSRNTNQIKNDDKINVSANDSLVKEVETIKQENSLISETSLKSEINDGNSVTELNLLDNKSNTVTKMKDEVPDPNHVSNITENVESNSNDDDEDISDLLTQVNPLLDIVCPTTTTTTRCSDSDSSDIFDACTQVNKSLKTEPLLYIVKRETSIKVEPDDSFSISAEETQLNIHLHERDKNNKNQRMSKSGHARMAEDVENNEGEETQPNLLLYSSLSESKIKIEKGITDSNIENVTCNQPGKAAILDDSDNTDVEEDTSVPGKIIQNSNPNSITVRDKTISTSVIEPQTVLNSPKPNVEHEMDENSNQSDSLFATVPIDSEHLEPEALHQVSQNCSVKEKENDNSEDKLKLSQTSCDGVSKKNQQEFTEGDMDICSTVGNGTFVSACGSLKKVQSSSKNINCLENPCKKTTSESTNVCVGQKKVCETTSLNHSIMFSEPCGSSTPFRAEDKTVTNKKAINKTPPRAISSPELPCTDDLVEVATLAPERNSTPVSESIRPREDLPLALKRTPRARKLSRKVAEALEEQPVKDFTRIQATSLSSDLTNHKNKSIQSDLIDANMEQTNDNNERIIPLKRSKSVGNKNRKKSEEKDKKSAEENDRGDILDFKNIDNDRKLSECGKDEDTKGKEIEKKDNNESFTTKSPDKHKPFLGTNIRKSKRGNKEVILDTSSKKELIDERKSVKVVNSSSELKNKSVDDSTTKPDTRTRKNNSRNKEEVMKFDIKTASVELEIMDEDILTSSKTKTVERVNKHVGETTLKKKLQLEGSNEAILEKPNMSDDHNKKVTKSKNPIRSRVKPARFRVEDDIDGSDASCVSDRNLSSGKRLRGRHVSTSGECGNSTVPGEGKNTSNEKYSARNATRLKCKEDVEDFSSSCFVSDKGTSSNKMQKGRRESKNSGKFTVVSGQNKNMSNEDHSAFTEVRLKRKGKISDSISFCVSDEDNLPNKRQKGRQQSKGCNFRLPVEDKNTSNEEHSALIAEKLKEKEDIESSSSSCISDKRPSSSKRRKSKHPIESNSSKSIIPGEDKNTSKNDHSACSVERLNEKEDIEDFTNSSDVVNNKGPSPSKRRKARNGSAVVECSNSTVLGKNKTKNNEHSSSIMQRSSKKKVDGSISSGVAGVKKSLLSTRRTGRHDSTSEECTNTTISEVDKNKSKEEESVFIARSKLTSSNVKKDSEIFKSPVIGDRSRSRSKGSNQSRSRSRSDSNPGLPKNEASSIQSPRRQGTRGKHVLFASVLTNPTMENQVKKLGGSVVDCAMKCSLLVADKVRRTVKFLCVLGQGKPIVSPDWLTQSWRCTSFLEPMDHLLLDEEAEDKFKFSLSETTRAASNQPLLKGFHIHATPSVQPPPEDIKSIVECCGGEYLEKVPSKWPANVAVISHVNDKPLWKKLKVKGTTPPIVAAEMLLIGVLQHKLEVEPHRIS